MYSTIYLRKSINVCNNLVCLYLKKKTLKNGYLWWKWEMGAEEPVGGDQDGN